MTPGELYSWYRRGQWPCGHGDQYLAGPRGGMAMNIQCTRCEMRLNVLDPEGGLLMTTFGQVIREPAGYKPPVVPMTERLKTVMFQPIEPPVKQPGRLRRFLTSLRLRRS